jgi:glycosyltransferase involved in cell wall biosynthesis
VTTLDVVVPMYNESEMVETLLNRLRSVFRPQALADQNIDRVQFIFVDDGSKDDTAAQLQTAITKGFPGILLRLSRNFGHQNAISAGLSKSKASVTAIMDADLQDPPETILAMVALWRQGNDVVYGVRRKRKEGIAKRSAYSLYYRLLRFFSEVDVPRDSGDFGLMDRRVVQELMQLPEKLRFPRGLRAWVGFRQIGLEYEREARTAGESKYLFGDLYKLATDGIVSLSARPLKLVQFCAFIMAGFLFLSVGATFAWAIQAKSHNPMELWFLISYTLSALTGFFTLLSLFVISGYMGRMFFEIKARPSYIIMEQIDAETLALSSEHGIRSTNEYMHRIPLTT